MGGAGLERTGLDWTIWEGLGRRKSERAKERVCERVCSIKFCYLSVFSLLKCIFLNLQ